jgi:hypothetical protein
MGDDNLLFIKLKSWGAKDRLCFSVSYADISVDLEMKFIIVNNETPNLRPLKKDIYEQQIQTIEEIRINTKEHLEDFFKRFAKVKLKSIAETMEMVSKKIYPINIKRKRENDEVIVEFYFEEKGNEFNINYYPEKNVLGNSTINAFIKKRNIFIRNEPDNFTKLVESDLVTFYLKKKLQVQVKEWLKKEKEIKMSYIYR